MSRVGQQPVQLPAKVTVKIDRNTVTVAGPKGEMTQDFNPELTIRNDNGSIVVERPTDLRHHRALHGLTRALLANMVVGVSEGFRKTLQIQGVGYQATLQGSNLQLRLGTFSRCSRRTAGKYHIRCADGFAWHNHSCGWHRQASGRASGGRYPRLASAGAV